MKLANLIVLLSALALSSCAPQPENTQVQDGDSNPPAAKVAESQPQTDQPQPTDETRAEFDAIVARFNQAGSEFREALGKVSREERQSFLAENPPPRPDPYGEELMQLARDNPDADAAFDALTWIVTYMSSSDLGAEARKTIASRYADSDRLAEVIPTLSRGYPSAEIESNLVNWMRNSNSDAIKGVATMALVKFIETRDRYAEILQQRPESAARYPETVVAYLQSDFETYDVEQLLETIVKQYPKIEYGKPLAGRPAQLIGDLAERQLFALRNLAIGKVAPDIEGVDLDGQEFKLSDYRGKIVMLDFWGDW